jgi:hypothetical protein
MGALDDDADDDDDEPSVDVRDRRPLGAFNAKQTSVKKEAQISTSGGQGNMENGTVRYRCRRRCIRGVEIIVIGAVVRCHRCVGGGGRRRRCVDRRRVVLLLLVVRYESPRVLFDD